MSHYQKNKSYVFTDKYIIIKDDNYNIENIELSNHNNELQNSLFENFDKIIFNKNEFYDFSKILLHLNNGIILVHCNSYYEKESRDGVDLSREYDSIKLINLDFDSFINISEKKLGRYYGLISCKLEKKSTLSFHCFEYLFISNLFDHKYIKICKPDLEKFEDNLKYIKSQRDKLSELLKDNHLFSMYDYHLNEIAINTSFYNIVEIISNTNEDVDSLFRIIKKFRSLNT